MVHIFICSPFPALRAGLRALISADCDLTVAAEAARMTDMVQVAPEVSVIVATSGALTGGEALSPGLAVLLVSDDVDEAQALAEQDLRAWGVISPNAPAEALQAAVRALAEGLVTVSPQFYRLLRSHGGQAATVERDHRVEEPFEPLTDREGEVLRCLAQGLTNKQIGLALKISEHTVKFHVSSIYTKLDVSNRAEAVRRGARAGLVPL